MRHSYVGVEHLFLAIIRERAAVPTQVLAGLIDLDRVEAALVGEMGSARYRGETPGSTELAGGRAPRYVPDKRLSGVNSISLRAASVMLPDRDG